MYNTGPQAITGMYTDVGRLINTSSNDYMANQLGVAKFLQDKQLKDIQTEEAAYKLKDTRLEQERLDKPITLNEFTSAFGQKWDASQVGTALPPVLDTFTKSLGITIEDDGTFTQSNGRSLTVRDASKMGGALSALAISYVDPESAIAGKRAQLQAAAAANPEDVATRDALHKLEVSAQTLDKNPLPIYEAKLRAMDKVMGQIGDWGGNTKIIESERSKLLGQIDVEIKRRYDESQKLPLKLPDGSTIMIGAHDWAAAMGHLWKRETDLAKNAIDRQKNQYDQGITPEKIGEMYRKTVADVDTMVKNSLDPAGRLSKPALPNGDPGGFYSPAEVSAIRDAEVSKRFTEAKRQMQEVADSYGVGKMRPGTKPTKTAPNMVSAADVSSIQGGLASVVESIGKVPAPGSPEESLAKEKDASLSKISALLQSNKVTEAQKIVDDLKVKAEKIKAERLTQGNNQIKKEIAGKASGWLGSGQGVTGLGYDAVAPDSEFTLGGAYGALGLQADQPEIKVERKPW